jgi:hypothetical protein
VTTRIAPTVVALAMLAGCNGQLAGGGGASSSATSAGSSGASQSGTNGGSSSAAHESVEGSAFECTLAANGGEPAVTFSGTRFNAADACLTGSPVTLPVCGCAGETGLGLSTWCFAAPDGSAYFTTSDDDCDIQTAPGWYAVESQGVSPSSEGTSAQVAACAAVANASTVTGTGDLRGPPMCSEATDGGSCVYPAGANTFIDASSSGCRPSPTGQLCGVSSDSTVMPDGSVSGGTETCSPLCAPGSYQLTCTSGPVVADSPPIPSPDSSLGCTILGLPTPSNQLLYCCRCAG